MATTTKVTRAPSETAVEAWKAFLKSNSRLTAELDGELRAEHGMGLGDLDVLAQLAEASGERLRMCDLAEAVVMSPSGLSRRVDRLQRAGMVMRERAKHDARNVEAALTAEGKRTLARLRKSHRAAVNERFAERFSDDELAALREYLGRLLPVEHPG